MIVAQTKEPEWAASRSFATLSTAQREEHSRVQPQEQVTSQRGFVAGMCHYRLQLQSRRQARRSAASTARAHNGSRVVGTWAGGGSRMDRGLTSAPLPRSPSRYSSLRATSSLLQ